MNQVLRNSLRAAPLMFSALLAVACAKSVDYAEVEQPKGPPPPVTDGTDKPVTKPTEKTACVELAETAVISQKDKPEILGVCDDGGLAVVFTSFKKGRALELKAGDPWFVLAKLVPGDAQHSSHWQSYINKVEKAGTPGAAPLDWTGTADQVQATAEFSGALTAVTTAGDGVYVYKFAATITEGVDAPVAVAWEPALTHRVGIEFRGDVEDPALGNPMYTWQPSTGKTTGIAGKRVVEDASCLSCHGALELHGGARVATDYCVLCHNPGSADAQSGNSVDFKSLVHKLHAGDELPSVVGGKKYAIWGYMNYKSDFSTVAFPQDLRNCIKCHDPANPATPEAADYLAKPTIAACTTCHDTTSFASTVPAGMVAHPAGPAANDAECQRCHVNNDEFNVEMAHRTPFVTPHNPNVPPGTPVVTYELQDLTLAGNPATMPVVTFRIKVNGQPLVLQAPQAISSSLWRYGAINGKNILGLPSFLVAFSVTESTFAQSAWPSLGARDPELDYNNWFTNWKVGAFGANLAPQGKTPAVGKRTSDNLNVYYYNRIVNAQPQSIGMSQSINAGMMGYPNGATFITSLTNLGNGYYRTAPFKLLSVPTNAKNVTVVMQGYLSIDLDGSNTTISAERFGDESKVVGVGVNDSPRRRVVAKEKCANCHERLSLHGGNRVADPNVCVVCHNPNATDRGRHATTVDGLLEQSIEFGSMIHRIHKGEDLASDHYIVATADFKEVRFPGNLKNCETCHNPGTYGLPVAEKKLAISVQTTNTGCPSLLDTKNNVVDNIANTCAYPWDDLNITPTGAACTGCHDKPSAVAHANASPAFYSAYLRGTENDSCVLCHGPGTALDPTMFHK